MPAKKTNMGNAKLKNKRAQGFLTENVVFIIIAVAFIAILFAFLYRVSSTTISLEESNAKNIALMIDSARQGTTIEINIDSLIEKKSKSISDLDIISFNGNLVTVKLKPDSSYSYGFFNNATITKSINSESGANMLVLKIGGA